MTREQTFSPLQNHKKNTLSGHRTLRSSTTPVPPSQTYCRNPVLQNKQNHNSRSPPPHNAGSQRTEFSLALSITFCKCSLSSQYDHAASSCCCGVDFSSPFLSFFPPFCFFGMKLWKGFWDIEKKNFFCLRVEFCGWMGGPSSGPGFSFLPHNPCTALLLPVW